MYIKTMKSGVFFLFMFFLAAGCSVKEDRDECPCILVMDFSCVDTSLVKSVNVLAESPDGIVFFDSLGVEAFEKEYVREVPHSEMCVSVWGGSGADEDLQIPYGCECPYLYMYAFEPDTRLEMWRETVDLKKNHCRLTVLLDGREDMPYCLTFRGNVDGYGNDGFPTSGDFACVAYPSADGGSQVVVPRQTDSSLMLEVDDMESMVTKVFAIGEYLDAAGYDWTAEELDDATVIIDYYLTKIQITFRGWDNEYSYDIIL